MEVVGVYSNQTRQSQHLRELWRQVPKVRMRVVFTTAQGRQEQHRLNSAQLAGLAHYDRSGVPVREIAAHDQVDRDTVNEHARRMGLARRFRAAKKTRLE